MQNKRETPHNLCAVKNNVSMMESLVGFDANFRGHLGCARGSGRRCQERISLMMDEESEQKINKYQQHLFFFLLFWQIGVIQGHTFGRWKCSQSSVLSNHVEVRTASSRAGFKKKD